MQIQWALVCVEGAEGSKRVCGIPVVGQTKVHDSTRSQGDSKDILWKCRGHAEHIFPEHICNEATVVSEATISGAGALTVQIVS